LALPFPSLQIQKPLDLDMNGESDRNGPASKFCLSLQEVLLAHREQAVHWPAIEQASGMDSHLLVVSGVK
jgi:hypothetical protein